MPEATRDCIQTARLVLRPYLSADADRVVSLLGDFEVSKWLAKIPHPFTHTDLKLTNDDGSSRWPDGAAITLDGVLIGGISCGDHLGYWIAPDHWGRGYASEAAAAAADDFFQRRSDDQLASGYFEGNEASLRILKRLGFHETARYDLYNRAYEAERPNVDMSLSRADWEARQ